MVLSSLLYRNAFVTHWTSIVSGNNSVAVTFAAIDYHHPQVAQLMCCSITFQQNFLVVCGKYIASLLQERDLDKNGRCL